MKKLAFYFLLLGVISLASCDKDDDNNSFSDDLAGLWYVTSNVTVNCDDPVDNQDQTFDDNCDNGDCMTIEFTSGGDMEIAIQQLGLTLSFDGTWSGDADNFEICIDGDCGVGMIDIDGDEATITAIDDEDNCESTIIMVRD